MAPELLATDGIHMSQREKRALGQELAGLIDSFKLDSKGEGNQIKLLRDEPGGGMPGSEVRSIAQMKCVYANA